MLGHEGKLARTTRIYAKYDPARLGNVTRALTTIWLAVSRAARSFGSDHILTTKGQGGELTVDIRSANRKDLCGKGNGGRGRD